MNKPRYRDVRIGACLATAIDRRADGTTVLRSDEPLAPFPATLLDRLEQWANAAPDRTFVAKRAQGGDWERISYAQMHQRARPWAGPARARPVRGAAPSRSCPKTTSST